MSLLPEKYPLELQQALAPITAISTPPQQGMTSTVIFAETALGSVAIKNAIGPRLAALRRERTILDALRTSALPVPQCLRFVVTKAAQQAEGWLVMRRLPGQSLLHLRRMADQTNTGPHLLRHLGKLVAQLHAIAVPPELVVERLQWLETMLEQAEANLALGIAEGNRTQLEELKQQRAAPVKPTFIHGDLFLDNVLSDGIKITGLIDWAFGAMGDPRYDLALVMYGLSALEQDAFLEGYGRIDGLSHFDMEYFLKLARFY
jgi:aminoglycoside phosphotransferase